MQTDRYTLLPSSSPALIFQVCHHFHCPFPDFFESPSLIFHQQLSETVILAGTELMLNIAYFLAPEAHSLSDSS